MDGEALAVGAGARDDDGDLPLLGVKMKGLILFGKWSGVEVAPCDGEELVIMRELDVMDVLK